MSAASATAKQASFCLGGLFAVVTVVSALAQGAADFPSGYVRIIVPFAAGGPTDVVARKLIAGAGKNRLPDRLNAPTIAETYPGFDVTAFNAAAVPAATPRPVVEKLSADIRAVVNSKEFAEETNHLGIFPQGNTPAEVDAWMKEQTARWVEIAKAAGIKGE